MADERIEIEIILDDGSVKKAFTNIRKDSEKSGKRVAQNIEKPLSSSFKNLGKLLAPLVAGFAVFKTAQSAIRGLSRSIKEAVGEENSVNRLNTALALTGKFSSDSSRQIRELGDTIQATTKFGNEAVLESAALIQSLGNLSVDSLERSTRATTDLAAALNIDLRTAANLVGRAAAGNVEAFGRYGIQVKSTGDAAKDFANVLGLIETRFSGAAQRNAETFEGVLIRLGNAFSDFRKEIGKFFTQSPALIATFETIFQSVNGVKDSFRDLGSPDIIRPIVLNFSIAAQTIVATLSDVGNSLNILLRTVQIASNALTSFRKASRDAIRFFANDLAESFSKLGNADGPVLQFFDQLIEKVGETSGKLNEFGENVVNVFGEDGSAVQAVENFSIKFSEAGGKLVDIGQQIGQGIANALSQGIQGAVNALISGENAFKAFGKAVLGVFGDLAIQLGTFFIAQGIAVTALNAISGSGAIAAGAALVALGTLLKSFSGGSGIASGGSSPNGVGGSAPDPVFEPDTVTGELEKSTAVTINVEGTVLDPVAVGQQISSILEESFNASGTRVLTQVG